MSEFYKYPVNYQYGRQSFSVASGNVRSSAPEISDNDYSTFSSAKSFAIDTFGITRATNSRITHIFLKGQNIDSYSVFVDTGKGSGTGLSSQAIPSSGTVNGVQHDLRALGPLMATEVRLSVIGTGSRVIQVLLLESLLTFEQGEYQGYQNINPQKIDRTSQLRTNIRGSSIRVRGLARAKWSTDYQAWFADAGATPTSSQLMNVFDTNTNFTFTEDNDTWPERTYAATLTQGFSISYVGNNEYNQVQMNYTILEI